MTKVRANCCGDVVESKHRHDFVTCSCGESFVDGGNDYLRVGGPPGNLPTVLREEPNVQRGEADEGPRVTPRLRSRRVRRK